MKRSALSILVLFLSMCSSRDNPPNASEDIVNGPLGEKLETNLVPYVEKLMADHKNETSIAIAVTKGNEIIFAKAFGYENIETRKKANLNTIYHFASVSKPFVATGIVKLNEQGKLNLDDPIIKHLPYFKLDGEGYEKITIKQVLTHTSGIPRNTDADDWKTAIYSDDALEKYVRSLSQMKMIDSPGTRYSYSNIGFNCLADVIAKASGMTFTDFMKEHILEPSGMHNSTFFKPDYLPENWASPHVLVLNSQRWDAYPYNRIYGGSAGLHASVSDMSKWGIINLNHGSIGNQKLLDSSTYDLLIHPWQDTPWGEKIGLSWYLQQYQGIKTILHTGENTGFSSQFLMLPEKDISIVVVANRNYSRTARITNAVIEILFDLKLKDYKVSGRIPFGEEMAANGVEAAKIKWHALQSDSTNNYVTTEWEMNVIGHSLIEAKRYQDAKDVFQFNIEEYPESANVYDSYGDALLAEGDTLKAMLKKVGMVLILFMALLQGFYAAFAYFDPLAFATMRGTELASMEDLDWIRIYASRTLFIAIFIGYLLYRRNYKVLSYAAIFGIVMPITDAFLAHHAGASPSVIIKHLATVVYLIITFIVLRMIVKRENT